jgi:hypothetical protein
MSLAFILAPSSLKVTLSCSPSSVFLHDNVLASCPPSLTYSVFASHLPHAAYTLTCEATRSVDRGIHPDIRNEPLFRTMRRNLSFFSICISQYSFRRLMQVARKNMRISLKTSCFSDGMCRRTARDVK